MVRRLNEMRGYVSLSCVLGRLCVCVCARMCICVRALEVIHVEDTYWHRDVCRRRCYVLRRGCPSPSWRNTIAQYLPQSVIRLARSGSQSELPSMNEKCC